MNKESALMRNIQIRASELGRRYFRINVGLAWCGKVVKAPSVYGPRAIVILNARPFKAGVKGMSDLCGWETITVTQEMVGQKIAVFHACEVKDGTNPTIDQLQFISTVAKAGGRGFIARSLEDIK